MQTIVLGGASCSILVGWYGQYRDLAFSAKIPRIE